MSYWFEDYDSGEWYLGEHADAIVKRCKEIINNKKFVRVGYVILNEMKLTHASKADLLEIVAAMEETGKYQIRTIRCKSGTDFIVTKKPKESFKEKHWYLIEAGKVSIGIIIGYVLTRLFHI